MWPSLISKAKEGGLDVIQTYVFWNLHEPQPGQVSAIQIPISLLPSPTHSLTHLYWHDV